MWGDSLRQRLQWTGTACGFYHEVCACCSEIFSASCNQLQVIFRLWTFLFDRQRFQPNKMGRGLAAPQCKREDWTARRTWSLILDSISN